MTLSEAKIKQKERERKAIISFSLSLLFIAIGSFLLFYFTEILTISSIFYLFPVALIALALKKTRIYKFLEPREFVGNVVRMDVYPVKVGKIHGDDTYEQTWGETLEVSLIVDDGRKTKSVAVYAAKETWYLAEGKKVAILRFIYYPIIIEN